MEYTEIISVQDAKNYLRIDEADESENKSIELMIGAAFKYIEKETNILFKDRDKDYAMLDYCVRVYDHPINEVLSPLDDLIVEHRGLYSIFLDSSRKTTNLKLNVGYSTPENISEDLILIAYKLIEITYYQKDVQGGAKTALSNEDRNTLFQHKRFIL